MIMRTDCTLEQQPTPVIVQVGLDESGSLTDTTPFFTMAAVITQHPDALRNLIRRAALRSGKQLKRSRKNVSELKWSNSSQRIRDLVLTNLAKTQVEIFALTVLKGGRRIKDTPENYAVLTCELLSLCWDIYPNMALLLDRHFTSPAQIAAVDTFIHRHWPAQGTLSITHVDSQRSVLVQLADFVAGCIHSWHKDNDTTLRKIEGRLGATLVKDWRRIKAPWMRAW